MPGTDAEFLHCVGQGCGLNVQTVSNELIHATVHALPLKPDEISNLRGPALEVTKVDAHTADIKIIHGFRAHFRSSMKKKHENREEFENCLIQAPGEQLKKRVLHRGSLSFSDLTELENVSSYALDVQRQNEWEINPAEIQLGRRIAVGGFAEVFVAEYQVKSLRQLLVEYSVFAGHDRCSEANV